MPQLLEPPHQLAVHGVGSYEQARRSGEVLINRPVGWVHKQGAGLPAAESAVAADKFLEGGDLTECGVLQRVHVDVWRA